MHPTKRRDGYEPGSSYKEEVVDTNQSGVQSL